MQFCTVETANELPFIPICAKFKFTFLFYYFTCTESCQTTSSYFKRDTVLNREFISLEDRVHADFLGVFLTQSFLMRFYTRHYSTLQP